MSPSPMQVQGSVTGIKFALITAGGEHTLACSNNGELYAWGSNEWGQLGTLYRYASPCLSVKYELRLLSEVYGYYRFRRP